ncbi:MAG: hypothetical protein C0402_04785 [Thermodesulfovibrio sp.]|nr:hypothetical protein [Thermodesulfovibrio sp.]
MGFFGKLFGAKEEILPALDPVSPAAQNIKKFHSQFEALANKVDDRYEVVPSSNILYVFLGKPPGMFGIAWFVEGDATEHNLKTLMAKKGLSVRKIDNVMGKLRTAYTESAGEARFSVEIAGKKAVVAPSDAFAAKLYTILHMLDE